MVLTMYFQGCDFPAWSRVIQFLITDNFDSWIQRGGRGGRGGELCRSTLLVQPGVTKAISTKNIKKRKPDGATDDEVQYKKHIEDPDFREYVTTENTCLREIANKHYDNPPNEGKVYSH
jgi:superfamily II DNA/RNA helicase